MTKRNPYAGSQQRILRDYPKLLKQRDILLEAAKGIAVRFSLEHQTTNKRCHCLQFEDNQYCRHLYLLAAIAKAEGSQQGKIK